MEIMRTVFSWPPGLRKTMLLGSLPSPVAKKAVRKYFFGSRLARGRLVPRILGPLVARIFPGRRCTHLHAEGFNFKSEEKTLPCLLQTGEGFSSDLNLLIFGVFELLPASTFMLRNVRPSVPSVPSVRASQCPTVRSVRPFRPSVLRSVRPSVPSFRPVRPVRPVRPSNYPAPRNQRDHRS